MFLALVVTILIAVRPLDIAVVALLAGATLLVAVMLVDDLRGLRAREKLLAQVVAAAIAVGLGIRIDAISAPFGGVLELQLGLAVPLTLFWIVGMMNAVNFMDGLDGLAAGVSVIAALVLVALSDRLGLPQAAELALAIAAVGLGFLPFNAYRARIIMGDTGSHLLGFTLAVVAILGPAKLATAILVLGVPILDVAWSIVRRIMRRSGVGQRDAGHLHHRLWEAGLPQPAVAALYFALTGAAGLIALLVERVYKAYAFAGLAAVVILMLVVLARLPRRRTTGDAV